MPDLSKQVEVLKAQLRRATMTLELAGFIDGSGDLWTLPESFNGHVRKLTDQIQRQKGEIEALSRLTREIKEGV